MRKNDKCNDASTRPVTLSIGNVIASVSGRSKNKYFSSFRTAFYLVFSRASRRPCPSSKKEKTTLKKLLSLSATSAPSSSHRQKILNSKTWKKKHWKIFFKLYDIKCQCQRPKVNITSFFPNFFWKNCRSVQVRARVPIVVNASVFFFLLVGSFFQRKMT